MLLSTWTQHWLSRMQRYLQMPGISDPPASCLSSTLQRFSGQRRVGATLVWGRVVFKWKQLEVLWFLPALLSLAVPKRSDEGWAWPQLLFIYESIRVWWSGTTKNREETSRVLLGAPAAAGWLGRVEIVAASIWLEGTVKGFHNQPFWESLVHTGFGYFQPLYPSSALSSVPLPAACTGHLSNNCVLNYRLFMLLGRRYGAPTRYSSSPSCAQGVPRTCWKVWSRARIPKPLKWEITLAKRKRQGYRWEVTRKYLSLSPNPWSLSDQTLPAAFVKTYEDLVLLKMEWLV